MTGVRKGEEHVSIPLRRDGSWACAHLLMCSCGHVDMEEHFDRSTVQPYRAQRISWAHEAGAGAWTAHVQMGTWWTWWSASIAALCSLSGTAHSWAHEAWAGAWAAHVQMGT
jgi:citrate synthase